MRLELWAWDMQHSQNSSSQFDAFLSARLPRVPAGQLKFQSASEYACAVLLEKHCDWKAFPGATFQVPVGRCYFDFRVGNCLVEYHPISLRNELLTKLLPVLQSATQHINKDKKSEVFNALEEELKAQYIKRRGQLASAHPSYRECEVVCCFSPEQFIELVVHRHASKPISATADLSLEFRRLQQDGKKVWRA